jgi:hypothetical protein
MGSPSNSDSNRKQTILNLSLAVVAGQVGCLTLFIVLGAVLLGLWLDSQFGTKPVITFIAVIASIPVSVIAMLVVVRAAVSKIKTKNVQSHAQKEEEMGLGTNQNS